MAVVDNINGHKIIACSGKLGKPNGVGRIMFGWSQMGDKFMSAGIYRRNGRHHNQKIVRMKHYRPSNPQTTGQQSWRTTFAGGVTAWHTLTAIEKADWNAKRSPTGMSGFCRFMRSYLNSA